jgi:hypothetical protein
VPQGLSPFEFAPPARPAEAAEQNPFRTQVDSIEVDLDQTSRDVPAPVPAAAPVPPPPMMNAATGSIVVEPSTRELLERAARLGPPRMTWESIVLPSDPILGEKRQPHVAERRARFRKVVTVALGGCLALCIAAIGVSFVSGGVGGESASGSSGARTAPATAFVPVEKLDMTKHGRAHVHTAALVAPAPKAKRH